MNFTLPSVDKTYRTRGERARFASGRASRVLAAAQSSTPAALTSVREVSGIPTPVASKVCLVEPPSRSVDDDETGAEGEPPAAS